jgi:excisionase family DNA binding protein
MTKIIASSTESTPRAGTEADERLLTKSQLALRVGVSMRTIESWMAKKLIPYIKIRKTVRFHWPDVEQALKRRFGVGYAPEAIGRSVTH